MARATVGDAFRGKAQRGSCPANKNARRDFQDGTTVEPIAQLVLVSMLSERLMIDSLTNDRRADAGRENVGTSIGMLSEMWGGM